VWSKLPVAGASTRGGWASRSPATPSPDLEPHFMRTIEWLLMSPVKATRLHLATAISLATYYAIEAVDELCIIWWITVATCG
jgi:hypothetical protein